MRLSVGRTWKWMTIESSTGLSREGRTSLRKWRSEQDKPQ